MASIPKVKSEDAKITSFEDRTIPIEKSPAKNIFSNMKLPVITNPINPNRISKKPTSCLNANSMVKAGLVVLGTLGMYYLSKTINIFSYFGLGEKNSKDVGSSEIIKVKNRANFLSVKTNLETARQTNSPFVNQIKQTHKNRAVEFEEIKVEKLKDFPEVKEKNVGMRRSINPTFKGSYDTPGWAFDVALSGNYAYVAVRSSGLLIVDISDPSNPTFKSSYDTPGRALGVVLSGNYAYVADMDSGLQIIDISDPSNPTFKSSYDTSDKIWRVAVSENYAYVGVMNLGLQIIDISDPVNPTFKGAYNTSRSACGITIFGNYAHVGVMDSALQIIDISNPANPTFEGSYDIPHSAYDIALSGNYAYVVGGDDLGLQIIDVRDLSNPTFKGSYDTPGEASYEIALSGNYAYIADGGYNYVSGLQIIDISDPSNPTFQGSYNTPGESLGVALSGNYAYVADMDSGLQIITISSMDLNILTDSDIALIVIGPIIGAICISSFFCALIGGVIVVLRRHRNKTLGNENDTREKKQELEEESAKV